MINAHGLRSVGGMRRSARGVSPRSPTEYHNKTTIVYQGQSMNTLRIWAIVAFGAYLIAAAPAAAEETKKDNDTGRIVFSSNRAGPWRIWQPAFTSFPRRFQRDGRSVYGWVLFKRITRAGLRLTTSIKTSQASIASSSLLCKTMCQ